MDNINRVLEYIAKEKARAADVINTRTIDDSNMHQVVWWNKWLSRFEAFREIEVEIQKLVKQPPVTAPEEE